MTRFLLPLLMALGLFGAAPQASAACRWFGTQLECDLSGSQLVLGTQTAAEPAYAGTLRPPLLQGSDGLLGDRVVPEFPFRVEFQSIGQDPGLCRKIGNETYCY